jgi:hypothetical protein
MGHRLAEERGGRPEPPESSHELPEKLMSCGFRSVSCGFLQVLGGTDPTAMAPPPTMWRGRSWLVALQIAQRTQS